MEKVNISMEELKSFLAKRGEIDMLNILNDIEEEYNKHMDPDYNPESDSEEYEEDSEVSTEDDEEEEDEPDLDEYGLVKEIIKAIVYSLKLELYPLLT
mgnify:CR=1 FL=1